MLPSEGSAFLCRSFSVPHRVLIPREAGPPVSRVLSGTVINLCVPSPERSGSFPPVPPRNICRTGVPYGVLLRIGFTADLCCHRNGRALASVFPPLPRKRGGLFLLHFPGGYPRLTLSAILSGEARTFLTAIPYGAMPRDRSANLRYDYTTSGGFCQAVCGQFPL